MTYGEEFSNYMETPTLTVGAPVAAMLGSLQILKDGTLNSPVEIQNYYEQMLIESSHLEHLINDLLDLSRLQSGQFPLDLGELNLCDVLRDVTRSIRMKAQDLDLPLQSKLQIATMRWDGSKYS